MLKCFVVRQVVVLTNSKTGWVRLTAKAFLPRMLPLLRDVSEYDGASPIVAVPKRSAAGM